MLRRTTRWRERGADSSPWAPGPHRARHRLRRAVPAGAGMARLIASTERSTLHRALGPTTRAEKIGTFPDLVTASRASPAVATSHHGHPGALGSGSAVAAAVPCRWSAANVRLVAIATMLPPEQQGMASPRRLARHSACRTKANLLAIPQCVVAPRFRPPLWRPWKNQGSVSLRGVERGDAAGRTRSTSFGFGLPVQVDFDPAARLLARRCRRLLRRD
jgi:hypothetical protein